MATIRVYRRNLMGKICYYPICDGGKEIAARFRLRCFRYTHIEVMRRILHTTVCVEDDPSFTEDPRQELTPVRPNKRGSTGNL